MISSSASVASALLHNKLLASVAIATIAALYVWYSANAAYRRAVVDYYDYYDQYQQYPQDVPVKPSFPFRILAGTFVATYLTMFLAGRLSSATSVDTSPVETSDPSVDASKPHTVADPLVVRGGGKSVGTVGRGGGHTDLEDAMRHIDRQGAPF